MKSLPIAFAVLLICQISAAQPDASSSAKENAALAVSLRLSGEEYDPSKPAGTISCILRNKSDKDIVLSAEYDGETITLFGSGLRLWRRDRLTKGRKSERLTIAPGKEQKLFELSLAELLVPFRGKERQDRKWGWNWERRPEPPQSSIHKWRKPGYVESARFYVEIQGNSGKAVSEPVTLKVKDSAEAPK